MHFEFDYYSIFQKADNLKIICLFVCIVSFVLCCAVHSPHWIDHRFTFARYWIRWIVPNSEFASAAHSRVIINFYILPHSTFRVDFSTHFVRLLSWLPHRIQCFPFWLFSGFGSVWWDHWHHTLKIEQFLSAFYRIWICGFDFLDNFSLVISINGQIVPFVCIWSNRISFWEMPKKVTIYLWLSWHIISFILSR